MRCQPPGIEPRTFRLLSECAKNCAKPAGWLVDVHVRVMLMFQLADPPPPPPTPFTPYANPVSPIIDKICTRFTLLLIHLPPPPPSPLSS